MKKILFVIYALNNGGAERSLVNLLTEIDFTKYEVDLLLFAREGMFLAQVPDSVNIVQGPKVLEALYSQKKEQKSIKFEVYKYMATIVSRICEKGLQAQNAYRWIKFYSKITPKLKKKYDLAIAYISRDIMYYVDEKVNADKKMVFIHNDYRAAGHPKKYDEPYFRRMDALITISDTCTEVLKEEFPNLKEKIYNLPNIISSGAIRKRASEKKVEEFSEYKGIKIVSVGRLNVQKGFDFAIAAAVLLKKKGLKFKWLILGNGELMSELSDQIKKNHVEDEIILIGSRENPYIYMKSADIIAQTSRWEGKSVVLDEAKIIGTPIVTTNYPTAKDQIINEKEGIIVDMTPIAIAEGIERLVENKKLKESIHEYLINHEYGNVEEMKKYYSVFDS